MDGQWLKDILAVACGKILHVDWLCDSPRKALKDVLPGCLPIDRTEGVEVAIVVEPEVRLHGFRARAAFAECPLFRGPPGDKCPSAPSAVRARSPAFRPCVSLGGLSFGAELRERAGETDPAFRDGDAVERAEQALAHGVDIPRRPTSPHRAITRSPSKIMTAIGRCERP
jgi:hypothetical protein